MLHHDEQLTNEVREVRVVVVADDDVVFVHVQHFILIADTIVNIVSLIFLVLVLRRKFPRVAGNIFAIATEISVANSKKKLDLKLDMVKLPKVTIL